MIKALDLYRRKTGTSRHFRVRLDKFVPHGAPPPRLRGGWEGVKGRRAAQTGAAALPRGCRAWLAPLAPPAPAPH